jgi:hypothetical protein
MCGVQDYQPTCIAPYAVASPSSTSGPVHNLLVGTTTGSMMIYNSEMHLIWAAQMPVVAVALAVCNVCKVKGVRAPPADVGCWPDPEPSYADPMPSRHVGRAWISSTVVCLGQQIKQLSCLLASPRSIALR